MKRLLSKVLVIAILLSTVKVFDYAPLTIMAAENTPITVELEEVQEGEITDSKLSVVLIDDDKEDETVTTPLEDMSNMVQTDEVANGELSMIGFAPIALSLAQNAPITMVLEAVSDKIQAGEVAAYELSAMVTSLSTYNDVTLQVDILGYDADKHEIVSTVEELEIDGVQPTIQDGTITYQFSTVNSGLSVKKILKI